MYGLSGDQEWLEGFTLSDFEVRKLLTAAIIDRARRRSPVQLENLEKQRRAGWGVFVLNLHDPSVIARRSPSPCAFHAS
jgi:hypothetical protein